MILFLYLQCSNGWLYWLLNAIVFLILLFFLMITWFKKLWIIFSPINEEEPNRIDAPHFRLFKCLFFTSKSVMRSAAARVLIYFVSICVLTLSALIHLVRILMFRLTLNGLKIKWFSALKVECNAIEELLDNNQAIPIVGGPAYSPCLNTWVRSECVEFVALSLTNDSHSFPVHNTEPNFSDLYQLPICSYSFPFQTSSWRIHC